MFVVGLTCLLYSLDPKMFQHYAHTLACLFDWKESQTHTHIERHSENNRHSYLIIIFSIIYKRHLR